MKILHVMKDYKPNTGGSVVRNSSIIENYQKKYEQDEIVIVNLDGLNFIPFEQTFNLRIYREKTPLAMFFRIIKLLVREKFDILHAHNFRFYFISYVTKKLFPVKTKLVMELHAVYEMNKWKEQLSYWLLKFADGIIVLSNGAKNYLVQARSVDSNKIHVVRNGLSELSSVGSIDDNNEKFDNKNGYITLGYIGSFFDWQGVNFIVDHIEGILETNNNVNLVMVGDGPEYIYSEEKIQRMNSKSRITLIKNIDHKEINSIYQEIDIFMIPRLKTLATDTAIPLKLVEAMQVGKAIVASKVDGLTELLDDSNSVLYEANSVAEFTNAVQKLINDEKLRLTLGESAKDTIRNSLRSWEDSINIVYRLYTVLMRDKK